MKKRMIELTCAGLLFALCSCARFEPTVFSQGFEAETDAADTECPQLPQEEQPPQTEAARMVVVDICGAVQNPGVYELLEGSRVRDAVLMAGGLTQEADAGSVNQAAYVQDAEKIIVRTYEEAQQMPAQADASDSRININQADAGALCTLSGIGEARALDIIAYREANGPFGAIEDIMKVNGIKEATFARIKDKIAVR